MLKDPKRRVQIPIHECKISDYSRPINDNHVEKILSAHQSGTFRLQCELIVVMPTMEDQDSPKRFVIIDGQHRWKALKKLNHEQQSGHPTKQNVRIDIDPMTGERQQSDYINSILLDSKIGLEEQRIIANLGDRGIEPLLLFSDVDLVRYC
jgi:hypothetical protein